MKLGRRWQHSTRRDRALDSARKLYEKLVMLDGPEAVEVYHVLIDITDAWGFSLDSTGKRLVRHDTATQAMASR